MPYMQKQQQSFAEPSVSTPPERPGMGALACAAAIRGYQLVLRPVLPPTCRFAPSCSEYARTAVLTHGVRRGTWLAARRLTRCTAWHPGGWDPVPGTRG